MVESGLFTCYIFFQASSGIHMDQSFSTSPVLLRFLTESVFCEPVLAGNIAVQCRLLSSPSFVEIRFVIVCKLMKGLKGKNNPKYFQTCMQAHESAIWNILKLAGTFWNILNAVKR